MKPVAEVVRESREKAAHDRLMALLRDTTAVNLRDEELARMDTVYREATIRREKCSREDFAAGYVAALILHGHGEAFKVQR